MSGNTTGTLVNDEVLAPFLRHCYELSLPEDSEFEMERYIETMHPEPDGTAEQLRNWQRSFASGEVETEWCRGCWTLAMRNSGDDGELTILGCEECGEDVCEICHWHVPGPRNNDCVCWECAPLLPTAPERWERRMSTLRRYFAFATARGGGPALGIGTLLAYLNTKSIPVRQMLTLVEWRALARRHMLYTACCPTCGAVYLGEHHKDVELPDLCCHCGRTVCPACTGRKESDPTIYCRRCVD